MPNRKPVSRAAIDRGVQALDKAPDAFRTISEVAEEINVPQHVLRFWESRFAQIRPMKRGGGRRYYRPDDVDLLRGVRHLLYGEGYTIRGVQRILREVGINFVQNVWRPGAERPPPEAEDDRALDEENEAGADAPSEAEPAFLGFMGSRPDRSAEREASRREPTLMPVRSLAHRAIDSEQRRKLQSALEELIACRRRIESALAQAGAPETDESAGRGGEPGPADLQPSRRS